MDLLKSERGVMNLVYLGVLAALMFTHASTETIQTWGVLAGAVVATYTVAKSLRPNDPPAQAAAQSREVGVTITRTEASGGDPDRFVTQVAAQIAKAASKPPADQPPAGSDA
jgi:hypothetical protein